MGKRKKKKPAAPKPKPATLGDIVNVVQKPKIVYRCLKCMNEGHPREMTICVVLGDKVKVRAPVCRICHEERMRNDVSE